MKKLIMRAVISFTAAGILGLASSHNSVFSQETEPVGLNSFIQTALEHNPRIQKAYHKWEAEEYKVKQVKSLPDPRASYTYFDTELQTRVGPQENKYGFSQQIPFPGKLHLKGKAQSKQAQVLKEQYEAVKNEIIRDVKFVYYDLFWVDKAISINEEEKDILENLEKVAQRKYESNIIPQQDVVKAQVELSNIIKKIFLLMQNRQSLNIKMNSLLNRAQNTVIANIYQIEHKSFDHSLESILEKTKNSRQELIAANLSVEHAEYKKSLARMDYLPDFIFGTEFINIGGGTTALTNDGEDAWMSTISVNVPIWFGKLKAQLDESKAELDAALNDREDVENLVAFEAQDLYLKITTYKDIVTLYETALVPQAQQAFDVSQSGFEKDKVSFLDWLDTERTYLQTRLAYYKAIADYHKSIAFLERVVGEEL